MQHTASSGPEYETWKLLLFFICNLYVDVYLYMGMCIQVQGLMEPRSVISQDEDIGNFEYDC